MSDPIERILALIAKRGVVSTSDVARTLRVSRQAAHRRLRALDAAGKVLHQGAGRTAHWVLPNANALAFSFDTAGLAEDRVWAMLLEKSATLTTLTPAARAIASYAFMELLNNAIEHSGSKRVAVTLEHDARSVAFEIRDGGVGAFEKVRATFGLASELEALQELSKGKTTTAPDQHTGEGIFFSSKAVERFELEANGLQWVLDNKLGDFTVRSVRSKPGTRVRCVVPKQVEKSLEDVFGEFTQDLEFSRTRTIVRLFGLGGEFMSRSEARRMLHGLDRFREVVLDFDRVACVGQGFADEVFRVWALAHAGTRLIAENAVPAVDFMIRRALPKA